ncbi:MAG: DUF1549 domain-containing protein, partial [Pirellula sp.]
MHTNMRSSTFIVMCSFAAIAMGQAPPAQPPERGVHSAKDIEFFETTIRPLLAKHCYECHSEKKQSNGLRLDSIEAILRGGDTGSALAIGRPESSLLFQAVLQSGDLQMPPKTKLSSAEIGALKRWIELGAPWPNASTAPDNTSDRKSNWEKHWAFQPLRNTSIPDSASTNSANTHSANMNTLSNPVDLFVAHALGAASLSQSPRADRRTLLRRLTIDLTGLVPSLEEIQRYEQDESSNAYEQLVDRLLASPAYGQHMARDWLDVARYSDTKGYVYAREERFFVNASAYRDWVIQAFNSDMRYDRFLNMQIAADQFARDEPKEMAAMGFLTLGRRFLGVTHDIIDDRIDVVTRGTMGLTVSCARCHDHKYDPIPTTDYYSLYGVFQNCTEKQVEMDREQLRKSVENNEYRKELAKRIEKLQSKMQASRDAVAERTRKRFADYLFAQSELHQYPEEGFDTVLATTDLIPTIVRHWESYLAGKNQSDDPIFGPWFRYASLEKDSFPTLSPKIFDDIAKSHRFHPRIVSAFQSPPQSLREVADKFGEVFAKANEEIDTAKKQGINISAELEALGQVLYGEQSPCDVPDEGIVSNEFYFDSGTVVELWKLQGEVDRWRLANSTVPNMAVALFDRRNLVEPRVFKRGNPANKGDYV